MSPHPVSSTPILRTALVWSGAVTAVLAIAAAVIGFLVAGTEGLWSGLAGVLIAAVFLGITAASILIANRWYGDPLYVPAFFGIVLGGWLLKLVLFIVALPTSLVAAGLQYHLARMVAGGCEAIYMYTALRLVVFRR